MTLLDVDGKPTGEDDWSFATPMLFQWMQDERCRRTIVGRGVLGGQRATQVRIAQIGGLVHAAMVNGKAISGPNIRPVMLKLLQDRVCRVAIARVVLMNERELRDEYEAVIDAFDTVLAAWSKDVLERGAALAGPKPELPDAHPPARTRHEVMKEMQELRQMLEAQAESEKLVLRPFQS